MKRLSLIVLAILLAGVLSAGNALAADSFTVTVNAEVISSCQIVENGVLNFDDIDPIIDSGPFSAVVTTDPLIACTSGAQFTLTAAGGTNRTLSGPGTIGYTLNVPDGLFTGTGSEETIGGFGADIAAGDFTGKLAGTYTDLVTININFQ